jgi:hypothetical protein
VMLSSSLNDFLLDLRTRQGMPKVEIPSHE